MPKLQTEHVRKVFLDAFRDGREKDSPLGLFCMVLVSMVCIAAGVLGVACLFPNSRLTAEVRPLLGITVACWVLSFFFGMFFGQAQGFQSEDKSSKNGVAQVGCFLAILQFAGGGLYNGLRGLWRWASGQEEREVTLPIAVITLLCERPEEKHTISFLGSTLRKARVPVSPASLGAALRALVSKKLIDGDPKTGYCCTLKQVGRFLEEPNSQDS